MSHIDITNTNGITIGRIEKVRLADRPAGAHAPVYTDAYAADVLGRTGDHWVNPNGQRHYPTAQAAEQAIHEARANQAAPVIPKGLRLGANQKHALWVASISDGVVDDKYGPALEKKGLATEALFRYRLTDLGHEVADALFDADGNPR